MNSARIPGLLLSLLASMALAVGLLGLTPGVARADDPSYPAYGADYGEPGPGQLVTDVKVVASGDATIQCPAGYVKRFPDLNKGSRGDYVYTCLKFGTDATQGIGELYVSSNDAVPCDDYGRNDQQIDGDLNSGVVNGLGIDHQSLFYCIHRPGTEGGSARIPHPGEGYNTYFPTPPADSGKLLHDVQFLIFDADHLPGCDSTDCVDTSPVGVFAYLTAAVTINPYCQRYFGPTYHPLFQPWEYFRASGDQGADVPQDAQVFDLNAGALGNPLIYACGSYTTPDTTPPTVTASATTADGKPYTANT